MLEAGLGSGVKFLVALNLVLCLSGMAPGGKPELYDFNFTQFTDAREPGSRSPMANMANGSYYFTEAIPISKLLGETFL